MLMLMFQYVGRCDAQILVVDVDTQVEKGWTCAPFRAFFGG